MEPRQLSALLPLARASGAQLTLLGLWCLPIRPVLEDPYGLSETHFQICFSVIDEALFKIRGRIPGPSAIGLAREQRLYEAAGCAFRRATRMNPAPY
jgi:hypothetical protein